MVQRSPERGPSARVHRRQRLLVRQDRQILEHHIAVGVIEMAVRVDQHAQRLVHVRLQRIAELARKARVLLRIDDEQSVRRLDRAGIGIAADPIQAWTPGATVTSCGSLLMAPAYTTLRLRNPGMA